MGVYEELDVRPLINCAGTYTIIGGSRMHEETLAAMNEAARSNVVIRELQNAVHAKIAELTYNEGACVTAGAMAGVYLLMASCISMKYQKSLKYLSEEQIRFSEVIMFRAHRNPYDRGLETLGVKLVELGYPNNISIVTDEELENAISDRTVALLYLPSCQGGWVPPGGLSFDNTQSICQRYNIPLIVDAAAQLPPKSNLWTFTQAGAAAAAFSGGKDLKGPQTTGLVVGKKHLMDWMDANNFPLYGIGRMLKVGKEELAGIYTAVKRYMEQDEDIRREDCEKIVQSYVEAFGAEDAFHFERAWPNEAGQPIARARMIGKHPSFSAECMKELLKKNERSIFVMVENGNVYFNPMMITQEDASYVLSVLQQINERMKAN